MNDFSTAVGPFASCGQFVHKLASPMGAPGHLKPARRRASAVALSLGVAVAGVAISADAGNPFAFEPAHPETTRAFQYANMSTKMCVAELHERKVPFEHVGPTRGVEAPIRFTGPLRGVSYFQTYRTEMDPKAQSTILDCRLALAIDDFSQVLAKHGVVEVEYMSLYRHGRHKHGVRHPAGRAIDVATAKLKDGTVYSVHTHFYGRTGQQTCGAGADKPRRAHDGATFWRSVVCEMDRMRSFNLALTPNYDWGHRDHLHLEVRSGIRWFLTQ